MNLTKIFRTLSVSLVVALGWASQSQAAVTATFSAGATCGGATSAQFSPGGASVQVSLCMTTTTESTCGHTLVLQSGVGESGKFVINSASLGANYSDPNSTVTQTPLTLNNAPTVADFGGTSNAPVAPAANQLLATFSIAPQASATAASYSVSLNTVSIVAVDADGTCGATTVPTETPLAATFTLTRNNAPVFTSANATTFSTAGGNSFTVNATGSPTPTITAGTLPAGINFAGGAGTGTGTLSGTPSAGGPYTITFTATSGANTAQQTFTLSASGQASQTINFTNPGSQTFSSTPIPLTAVASSNLTVTFSTSSPSICTVSGANANMISLGTCVIVANQAGNAAYSAAPQASQSFGIVGTVPGAPTIGIATPGDGQALISFTPPASNGGSSIISYTATCGGITGTSATSPVSVTGLTNGTPYSCTVTATNNIGTGPASAPVNNVTPAAGSALSLVAVKSRKTHTGVGDFDIPIDFTLAAGDSTITVEPRALGAGHRIIFQFNNPITVAGTATATDVTLSAPIAGTVGAPVASGNEVSVTLTGTPDNKRVTISLAGVNGTGNVSATIGFLTGDVNGNHSVNGTDVIIVKTRTGQTANDSNFRFDINANGIINGTDVIVMKTRSGLILP